MGETQEATERTDRAVKFVGADTIAGLAMPYGIDTDGEQFTPDTDFCFDWYGKSGRPFLFEHGLDDSLKTDRIGTQVDYEQRDEGIWATVQLDRNRRYRKAVDRLIEEDAFGFSSGAMQHLTRKNASGEIKRWPWVELSGTPIPAHPDALGIHYVKSADFLARLEEDDRDAPPALKAALTALDEWANTDDSLPDGLKFADLIDRLSVDGPAWVKASRDRYAKSGRVLSTATRERLTSHPTALRQLADDLEEFLSSADEPKDTGKAALWAALLGVEATRARGLLTIRKERTE